MCRTCRHNPHIWSAVGEGTYPVDVSTDKTDTAVKKVEGDERNSFLRRAASPAPDLCVVCHEDISLPVGTDHDLFITGPSAKNRLGETITAEDKISPVATHPERNLINTIFTSNHQATGHIKIFEDHWKEVHVGDLLCSSCHSFHKWDHRISKRGIIKEAKER